MSYTYRPLQDGLRAAGHYLDGSGRRLASLLMVDDGIVVTLRPGDIRGVDEAVLLTDEDLQNLYSAARSGRGSGDTVQFTDPLVPTGYEDFLRALAAPAGQESWSQIRLVRLGDEIMLSYRIAGQRHASVMAEAEVEELLNLAFRQRGTGTTPATGPNIWVVPPSPGDETS